MVDPETITTSGIKVLRVLHNDGADGFSVARIKHPNGSSSLGIRWNGSSEDEGAGRGSQGYPTSRGKPVFFTIPADLEPVISGMYGENSRVLARSLTQ